MLFRSRRRFSLLRQRGFATASLINRARIKGPPVSREVVGARHCRAHRGELQPHDFSRETTVEFNQISPFLRPVFLVVRAREDCFILLCTDIRVRAVSTTNVSSKRPEHVIQKEGAARVSIRVDSSVWLRHCGVGYHRPLHSRGQMGGA